MKTAMTKRIVLQEVGSGRNYDIDLPCVVGRGRDTNLKFQDPSISQRHALIFHSNDQIWIEDLESANGVYVNDKKITKKALLNPGDCFQLGKTKLLVDQEKEGWAEQTLVLHSLDSKVGRELDQEKLQTIYKITAELSEHQDVRALGDSIFSKLKDIFKQDRSYLALFQEDGTLQPILEDAAPGAIPLSRTIVNRVFKEGESLLLEDALSDRFLKEQESIIALRIRSALCVPLIYHSQIYGLVYLDRNIPGAYTQDDLEFMTAIAFMLGPLIENARLWSELKNRYAKAMDTLRQTKARLIEMERKAAYVRLAQAMAHEIRNPLMGIGGLVRRIAKSESEHPDGAKLQAITTLVERVEGILKEVDAFVKLPRPHKRLERIDRLVQEAIDSQNWASLENGRPPRLIVNTSRLTVPLDASLFKTAMAMIFKEMASGVPKGSELDITIQYARNELEIVMGKIDDDSNLSEVFDPALQDKHWSLGLFLNIAHRIISDHGGRLLLDLLGDSAFPVLVRLPTITNA
jgi:pSer/pThr/pTyr-binding forkhead associated (FHA) protein